MRRLMALVLAALEAMAFFIDWVVDATGRLVAFMRRHARGYAGPDPAALAAADQDEKEADQDGKHSMSEADRARANDAKLHTVDQVANLLALSKCIASRQFTKIAVMDRDDIRVWLRDMSPHEGALLAKASSEQLLAIVQRGPSACRVPGIRVPSEDAKALAGAATFERECRMQSIAIFRVAQDIHGGRTPDLSPVARDDVRKWLSGLTRAEAYNVALADDSHRIRIAALGPSACEISGVYTPSNVKPFRHVYNHRTNAPEVTETPVDDGGVSDVMDWVLRTPGAPRPTADARCR